MKWRMKKKNTQKNNSRSNSRSSSRLINRYDIHHNEQRENSSLGKHWIHCLSNETLSHKTLSTRSSALWIIFICIQTHSVTAIFVNFVLRIYRNRNSNHRIIIKTTTATNLDGKNHLTVSHTMRLFVSILSLPAVFH